MQSLKGTAAEGRVSHADLIALGGAHAVFITGGPFINVPIGKPVICLKLYAYSLPFLALSSTAAAAETVVFNDRDARSIVHTHHCTQRWLWMLQSTSWPRTGRRCILKLTADIMLMQAGKMHLMQIPQTACLKRPFQLRLSG